MTNLVPDDDVPLSSEQAADSACDRYEEAFDQRPRIEDILQEASSDDRRWVLHELLRVELELLGRAGVADSLESYLVRFPGDEDVMRTVFRRNAHVPSSESPIREQLQDDSTFIAKPSTAKRDALSVRCPFCRERIHLEDHASLADVACPACGSHFNLVEDQSVAHRGTPETVGRFELIEPAGQGASGVVWRARDPELQRIVAVKVPRSARLDAEETARFLGEARAVAQLKHPNIVQVHEVGRSDGGVFIVSDFIEGQTLARFVTDNRLTLRDSAELCVTIAAALHHAHDQSVVHRDLKPSNILLTKDGEPKVTDFGLAKRSSTAVTMTIDGKMLGTPAYMPPEQARGNAEAADARSDVYSLGVILFELITGERPFRGEVSEVLHQAIHDEPPKPGRLNRRIPRDLETICLKCLHKEPLKRYQTAAALADDLQRYLKSQPISARRPGLIDRATKWVNRNRAVSVTIAMIFVAMLSVVFMQKRYSDRNLDTLARSQARGGVQSLIAGNPEGLLHLVTASETASPGWPAHQSNRLVWRAWHGDLEGRLVMVMGHDHAIRFIDLSADGKSLLTTSADDGSTIVWDVDDGSVSQAPIQHETGVDGVVWGPDNSVFVLQESSLLWQSKNSRRLFPTRQARVNSNDGIGAASHPAGGWLVTDHRFREEIDTDQGPLLWNLQRMELKLILLPMKNVGGVFALDFSSDGSLLAIGGHDGTVQVWATETASKVFDAEYGGVVDRVEFSADGSLLAVGGRADAAEEKIQIWEWQSGVMIHALRHEEDVKDIAFSQNGRWLLSGSFDGTATLWDVESGEPRRTMSHNGPVVAVAFAPNGDYFATGGFDGAVNIWDTKTMERLPWQFRHQGVVFYLCFTPDSERLVSGSDDNTVRVWKVAPDSTDIERLPHPDRVWDVSFSHDGRLLASAAEDGLRVWEDQSGQWKQIQNADEPIARSLLSVDFSPTANVLACGIMNSKTPGQVELWDFDAAELKREYLPVMEDVIAAVRDVTFSPDGKFLLVLRNSDNVELWDVKQRSRQWLAGPLTGVKPLQGAWNRSGSEFATGWSDGFVRIYQASHGDMVPIRKIDIGSQVEGLTFVDDSMLIVVAGDRTVRFLDAGLQQQSSPTLQLDAIPQFVAFDKTSRILAATMGDGTARLWDIETGLQCGPALNIGGFGTGLDFSPDGRLLATASFSGDVTIWDLSWNRTESLSISQMKSATSVAVGARLSSGELTTDIGSIEPLTWSEWQSQRNRLESGASR